MSDRELLELAAKAIGRDYNNPRDAFNKEGRYWDPLADDGDALRLAVKLKLNIMQGEFSAGVNNDEEIDECELVRNTDRAEVVRRLIVRAAAEIGRNMK